MTFTKAIGADAGMHTQVWQVTLPSHWSVSTFRVANALEFVMIVAVVCGRMIYSLLRGVFAVMGGG